jgi:trimethylamine:corrinoid methyltransferase-like protein
MYKLQNHFLTGEAHMVQRLADNAFIPFDPANADYQAYLKWLADGNEPLPADAPATTE